jgi:hypothetical protein
MVLHHHNGDTADTGRTAPMKKTLIALGMALMATAAHAGETRLTASVADVASTNGGWSRAVIATGGTKPYSFEIVGDHPPVVEKSADGQSVVFSGPVPPVSYGPITVSVRDAGGTTAFSTPFSVKAAAPD